MSQKCRNPFQFETASGHTYDKVQLAGEFGIKCVFLPDNDFTIVLLHATVQPVLLKASCVAHRANLKPEALVLSANIPHRNVHYRQTHRFVCGVAYNCLGPLSFLELQHTTSFIMAFPEPVQFITYKFSPRDSELNVF